MIDYKIQSNFKRSYLLLYFEQYSNRISLFSMNVVILNQIVVSILYYPRILTNTVSVNSDNHLNQGKQE